MKNWQFFRNGLYLGLFLLIVRADSYTYLPGIVDAYQEPFLYVYGTISPNSYENDVIEKTTLDVVEKWKIVRYREVPVKKDVDVTDDDIKKYNLMLYGNEHSNKIMKQIAKDLPIRIKDDVIIVGDRKYANWDEGAIFLSPNPLNPKKYVVVYGALTYHGFPHINSVNASGQDYIIFNNMTKFRVGETLFPSLEEGFFDKTDPIHWKVKPTPKPAVHIVEETSFQPILASTTKRVLERVMDETSFQPIGISTTKLILKSKKPAAKAVSPKVVTVSTTKR